MHFGWMRVGVAVLVVIYSWSVVVGLWYGC